MFTRVAFVVSMLVIAACAQAIQAGGLWLAVGVIVGIPAVLVWLSGLAFGVADLLGGRR